MTHALTFIGNTPLPEAEIRHCIESHAGAIGKRETVEPGMAERFLLASPPSPGLMAALHALLDPLRIDAVSHAWPQPMPRLLVSDMDSTIIAQECIDEMADMLGLKPKIAAITARAMNGELDFEAALRERVGLLKGLSTTQLQEVLESRITLMPGARTLVATLRARGCYCLLVSGGFTFFTQAIAARAGFDADEANRLHMENGLLTGTVAEPILGKEAKCASLLREAAARDIPPEATLAIGDGANDVPMLLAAGLGVAYHAKPAVEAQAQARIRHHDLSALLYVLGLPKPQWVAA
jgi:phosphoserine phosphatase